MPFLPEDVRGGIMATCKECGALLPMDYLLIGICRMCLDIQTEDEYDNTCDDLCSYAFMEENDE